MNAPVPPATLALPVNETTLASAPAQARAPCAVSVIDPALPLRTALPLKTTHVRLTKTPLADPRSVLGPMSLLRPRNAALPVYA